MGPSIDVVVTKDGPFPAAFLFLKHYYVMSDTWPKRVRKEQCLSLDCQNIDELRAVVQEMKLELDACVHKAARSFARINPKPSNRS
jgi:hypothetical protein